MKNNIKRAIIGILAGAALAVAGAGTANADATDYLTDVSEVGVYSTGPNPAGTLLAGGYWVCDALATHSAVDVARYIYTHTDRSITFDHAAGIVAAAVVELCPVYYNTPVDQPGLVAPYAPDNTTV